MVGKTGNTEDVILVLTHQLSHGLTMLLFPGGNLVGVGALLEREPVRYIFQATVDSSITIINDECMESELKSLPVWLLAVIKAISARTRRINESMRSAKIDNPLASLASFCKFFKGDDFLQNTLVKIVGLIRRELGNSVQLEVMYELL